MQKTILVKDLHSGKYADIKVKKQTAQSFQPLLERIIEVFPHYQPSFAGGSLDDLNTGILSPVAPPANCESSILGETNIKVEFIRMSSKDPLNI